MGCPRGLGTIKPASSSPCLGPHQPLLSPHHRAPLDSGPSASRIDDLALVMECPICWDSLMSASTPTVSIPCGHLFHEKCLLPYMAQRAEISETGLPDCPTCREPIKLITGHHSARIPRDPHELCHSAVRRVYLTSRETDANDTAKELDGLYTRVAHLQDALQHAREKELSAEGRVAAIMNLWKAEQVRVADLRRRLDHAVLAQQNMQAVKAEPRPNPPSAPSPRAQASQAAPDSTDQWRQLEDQMLMQAATQLSNNWGAAPPAPPPPAARPWEFQGQQQVAPQLTGPEMHPALHAPPAGPVAVVTHPVHSYQPQMLPSGSASGSVPPPPPPPPPQMQMQMQMMQAVPHPYASPSLAASPEMIAAPYGAPPGVPQAYAHPVAPQPSGSGAPSRTRHLAGFARERALDSARLQQQQQQQQQRWAQNHRVMQAYRQQHDAALAHVRQQQQLQQHPHPHSHQQTGHPGQPWAGPST